MAKKNASKQPKRAPIKVASPRPGPKAEKTALEKPAKELERKLRETTKFHEKSEKDKARAEADRDKERSRAESFSDQLASAKKAARAHERAAAKASSDLDKLKAILVEQKQDLEKTKKALKDLEGERRRLTTIAEKTERALAEEAMRRAGLEKRLEAGGQGGDALASTEAKVSELKLQIAALSAERDELRSRGSKAVDELTKRLTELEKLAGKPSPALLDDLKKKAEAAAESRVRALMNERDGLKARIKDLESTSPGAADASKIERLVEKCMDLERERDSYKERLTEAESQKEFAPSSEVVDRLKTSLADAERDRDRYREKVIDLEAQVAAIRGGFPTGHHGPGRVSAVELQSRLEESEREREKAERERDDFEKRLHALKTEFYARKTTPADRDARFCPGCGTEMRSLLQSSIHMDVCPQCSGVYLDKKELGAILGQEREALKDAKKGSLFGRIFGKAPEKS